MKFILGTFTICLCIQYCTMYTIEETQISNDDQWHWILPHKTSNGLENTQIFDNNSNVAICVLDLLQLDVQFNSSIVALEFPLGIVIDVISSTSSTFQGKKLGFSTTLNAVNRNPNVFLNGSNINYQTYRASMGFRIEISGEFRVILTAVNLEIGSPVFYVNECKYPSFTHGSDPILLLKSSAKDHIELYDHLSDSTLKQSTMEQTYQIEGILTMSGNEDIQIQHSWAKIGLGTSWALSFWVYLTKDSTGEFRTLFFNGDGSGGHRTPSAWWKPTERKITIRISTIESMDIGVDSKQEIPLKTWTQLALVFRNSSLQSNTVYKQYGDVRTQDSMEQYRVTLYVNGEEDTKLIVQYAHNTTTYDHSSPIVYSNAGPLHFGKDPWTSGMQGFVSNIKIFNSIFDMSMIQEEKIFIRQLYDVDKTTHFVAAMDFMSDNTTRTDRQGTELRICQEKLSNQINTTEQAGMSVQNQISCLSSYQMLMTRNLEAANSLFDKASQIISNTICNYRNIPAALERQAWDLLQKSAKMNHPKAQRYVGLSYLFGTSPTINYSPSIKNITHCAIGIPKNRFASSLSISVDCDAALKYLTKSFQGGDAIAGRYIVLTNQICSHLFKDNESESHKLEFSYDLTLFAIGLYHHAAVEGDMAAYAILGNVYNRDSLMVKARWGEAQFHTNQDVSVYHLAHAAKFAREYIQERGSELVLELTRLYDGTADESALAQGQFGEDDELIEFQKFKADEQGDVNAMATMGDLYYYGARGLPRDHTKAFQYYHQAAVGQHLNAQAAVASMFLKGEGTDQDNSSAIEWFSKAAGRNHTRGLNGLGYLHFHGGGGFDENKTLALEYFEAAAKNLDDGDSIFNTGFCYLRGIGTNRNISKAAHYLQIAAEKFGHFNSIYELGNLYWRGGIEAYKKNTSRDKIRDLAINYLQVAGQKGGPWAHSLRIGFDYFLIKDYSRASARYHEALEYGYYVALSNLAYLYDKLAFPGETTSLMHRNVAEKAYNFLWLSHKINRDSEVTTRLGDYHFYGYVGLHMDFISALKWYMLASANDQMLGAYNAGYMYEYGLGVPLDRERAKRLYHHVQTLSFKYSKHKSHQVYYVAWLAILRVRFAQWIENVGLSSYITSLNGNNFISDRNGLLEKYAVNYGIGVCLLTFILCTLAATFIWRSRH